MVPPEHLYPPDEWRVVEARYSEEFFGRAETVFSLGNGFLGVRGTFEEGRPALSPGTFINGFHETWPIVHAEEAHALARKGQTIVNVPDVTILKLYVDDKRARAVSQQGALFPWRTINGEEASSNFQAGTAQYHINAGIAYAIRRNASITGDMRLLGDVGAAILVETARLWRDLGFYGRDGRSHIHGVTGPDEYTTVVNDNTYTNLMARLNLNFAAATVRRLRQERPADYTALVHDVKLQPGEEESWERAAAAMHVPFDEARGIHPQDDTFLDREAWDLDSTPRESNTSWTKEIR